MLVLYMVSINEIDLQFVLNPYCAATGTDRLNTVVGLLDRDSALASSIQFADGPLLTPSLQPAGCPA